MSSHTFIGMKRFAPVAMGVVLIALVGGTALADLRSGEAKLVRGDYAGAKKDLVRVGGKDHASARVALVRAHLITGDYKKAEKVARDLAGSKIKASVAAGAVALAEVLRVVGRYDEGRKLVEPIAADKANLRARWMRGLLYRDLGRMADATQVFEAFITEFGGAGVLDKAPADTLFYVAEAARYRRAFEDANAMYRESAAVDVKYTAANVEWGSMFLAKYAVGNASQSFDAVLKINPHHPDAHAGMAQVKLEKSYDIARARKHLGLALAVNPRHVPSLLVRASIEIDQNKWDAAKATLAEVFAVNPMSFRGQAMLATVHWLRDDTAAYEAVKKKVFAANKAYAEFFHIIARSAVREHRYHKAIDLELEAVKIDPLYYEAMQGAGTGYLRLGLEKQGLEWLRKAWKGDEYNTRTYNTLNLFDDVIPKEYKFKRTKYFKFRYHVDEEKIISRQVEPLLTKALEDMIRRYKFTPKLPIVIELYRNPSHYSVRTVGLPNLGALGVCFGQVITAMSPSMGNVNWGMVLWHELSHVFGIQMSKSRVPRWFTEGLSEYETLIARPEWRREHDSDVYAALLAGELPSVAELNYGFMKPSMRKVVVAYYLSAVTIEYITQTYGFDKITEALALFGKGLETPAVIEKITGRKVAEFDKRFRAYLKTRLAPYKGTWVVPTEGFDSIKDLEIAVAAAPKDAKAHASLAMGQFMNGNASGAEESAKKALGFDKTNKLALYLIAEVTYRKRDLAGAKKAYGALIAAGGDNYDVRGRLAAVAKRAKNLDEAVKQLCAAKRLDPERSYPYMELAGIYRSQGKRAKALREIETYVMLEQMQYRPLRSLVREYAKQKKWGKVRRYGPLAVFMNPSDAYLFIELGDAFVSTDPKKAIFHFGSALVAEPQLRRPALAHIGMAKAYMVQRNKRKARASLRKALRLEPNNFEALELRKKLRKKLRR